MYICIVNIAVISEPQFGIYNTHILTINKNRKNLSELSAAGDQSHALPLSLL